MIAAPGAGTRRARGPFHVLAKPSGPLCNLECGYCFYLEKKALYSEATSFRMSDEVLERFIEQYVAAQPEASQEVGFSWQGGEPTLMGLRFFERVLELQARHARPGQKISNSLQTNATLLDDDWGRFLAANDFLVGVSIDGPQAIHDAERVDRKGKGSFRAVIAGIEVLTRNAVDFNTLTVLHRKNSDDPIGLYDFLKQIGSTFLQFIPMVEHARGLEAKLLPGAIGCRLEAEGALVSSHSITPRQWGECLVGIFDRWLECDDVGRIFVQAFDVMLGIVAGFPSTLCVNEERCGRVLAIEHNGDVYACDHFVSPEYRLGNVLSGQLVEMLESDTQVAFREDASAELPGYCRACRYLRLCWGACPKDRIARTPEGEPGLAYLCEGYKAFYRHSLPTMQAMARCLELGHKAADYRRLPTLEKAARRSLPPRRSAPRVAGRNAPCPCGSGAKYKKCCGR